MIQFLRKFLGAFSLRGLALDDQRAAQTIDQFPPAKSGVIVYAVGDIHGRLDLLSVLHEKIDKDWEDLAVDRARVEIYLGDMIDRGSDSAAVLEALIERRKECECVLLFGNHELQFLKVLDEDVTPPQIVNWLKFGGANTALSYGVTNIPQAANDAAFSFLKELRSKIPERHAMILRSNKFYHVEEPYLFVHAGIRPEVPLDNQTIEDLVGIREEFLTSTGRHTHIVVHGHTPVKNVDVKPNRINVDTGAFATGNLSCIRIGPHGVSVLR